MEGFSIASAPFEDWVLIKTEQFRQKVVEVLYVLVKGYESAGEHALAQQFALRWIEMEPWDEAVHRHMMRILAHKGHRSAALEESIALGQKTGERWFEAEAYRQEGELIALNNQIERLSKSII
jgi:DNA-binding SARP family transcriptional activator